MKTILVVIVFLFTVCSIKAQPLGLHAGITMNTSDINYPGVDVNRKVGFECGVFYQKPIVDEILDIRLDMLYFNNGFSLKYSIENNTGITYHFTEDNLKLPLTIVWKPEIKGIKPILKAGMFSSYAISGKVKDSESDSSLKYKNNSGRIDYGAIVGLGTYISSRIVLNVGYEYGFAKRSLCLGDQYVSVRNRRYLAAINYFF